MEALKKELKVGKWYKHIQDNYLFCLTEIDGNAYGYGVDKSGTWFCYTEKDGAYCACNSLHFNRLRKATDKEVEEALIAETNKRFGNDWKNTKIKECLYTGGCSINSGLTNPIIIVDFNSIWNRNGLIFYNGVWANALIEEKIKISKAKALKIIAKKLKVSPKNIIIE